MGHSYYTRKLLLQIPFLVLEVIDSLCPILLPDDDDSSYLTILCRSNNLLPPLNQQSSKVGLVSSLLKNGCKQEELEEWQKNFTVLRHTGYFFKTRTFIV